MSKTIRLQEHVGTLWIKVVITKLGVARVYFVDEYGEVDSFSADQLRTDAKLMPRYPTVQRALGLLEEAERLAKRAS